MATVVVVVVADAGAAAERAAALCTVQCTCSNRAQGPLVTAWPNPSASTGFFTCTHAPKEHLLPMLLLLLLEQDVSCPLEATLPLDCNHITGGAA